VIGHAKSDHRMDRNYLKGSRGDAINAVLAAAGYNFRRLLAWLKALLRAWLIIVPGAATTGPADQTFHPIA
jgi:IS5 family transposase